MKPQVIVWLMMLAGLGFFAAGCDTTSCTGRLWADSPTRYYRPSPKSDLKLFQALHGDDVLVKYTEQREKTGATNSRAYYLLANDSRVEALKKPHFVSAKQSAGLTPIPMQMRGETNLNAPLWAEVRPQGDSFRLYRNGEASEWYPLPVYEDKLDRSELHLLTPVAVAGDVCITGLWMGFFSLYAIAQSCH